MQQISIFLENKPGALNDMVKVLAENNVNLRAISLAESDGFGIVRIIVDDIIEASTVLKAADYIHNMVPVVACEVPDKPGALLALLDALTAGNVNIDYMYAFNSGTAGKDGMVFKVADAKEGEKILRGKGYQIIEHTRES